VYALGRFLTYLLTGRPDAGPEDVRQAVITFADDVGGGSGGGAVDVGDDGLGSLPAAISSLGLQQLQPPQPPQHPLEAIHASGYSSPGSCRPHESRLPRIANLLADLAQQMVSPEPSSRPSAAAVLQKLIDVA